ncbi:MAG: two pore domain potassium channel family protein, partial [Gemmatimonadetes bacterium]|nr:two pore domain potassium channel family protein [Gemmatimonadota bacterium]
YFLSGVFWSYLYQTLLLFYADAILFSEHVVGAFSDLIYFSFITMTTLGYGDIMPISRMAKNMAVLEAVWGQTYLAVLVARLVGLHLSGSGRFD